MYKDLPKRFHDKVSINEDTGCHEWTGFISPNGYGMYWLNGSNKGAHRVSCEAEHGIPDGYVVDHLCKVRHCVNPQHLEPVTQKVNVRRGNKGNKGMKTGAMQRAKTHCPAGHEYNEENTYVTKRGSRWCKQCRRDRRQRQRERGEKVQ